MKKDNGFAADQVWEAVCIHAKAVTNWRIFAI